MNGVEPNAPTDWNGLQDGLVLHGFLSPDAIVDVQSQDDISAAIADAIRAAQDSIGDAVVVEEHRATAASTTPRSSARVGRRNSPSAASARRTARRWHR